MFSEDAQPSTEIKTTADGGAFRVSNKGDKQTVTGKIEPQLEFALDATKEKLAGAPRYKVGNADQLFTREAGTPIYKYWDIRWVDEPAAPARNP